MTAKLFEAALGIAPPWTVASVEFDEAAKMLTVLIDFDAIGVSRRMVVDGLKAHGIGSQVPYIPVHQQPYYVQRYGKLALPGAQAWYDRCLTLPLYPTMTDSDVDRVVEALGKVLAP